MTTIVQDFDIDKRRFCYLDFGDDLRAAYRLRKIKELLAIRKQKNDERNKRHEEERIQREARKKEEAERDRIERKRIERQNSHSKMNIGWNYKDEYITYFDKKSLNGEEYYIIDYQESDKKFYKYYEKIEKYTHKNF